MFTTTQELKPQVVEILDPTPEEEFDLDPLLQEIEDRRVQYEKEQETSFSDTEIETPESTKKEYEYTKYQYVDKNYDYDKQKELIDSGRITKQGDRTFVDGYLIPFDMRIDSRFYDGKNPIKESEERKNYIISS